LPNRERNIQDNLPQYEYKECKAASSHRNSFRKFNRLTEIQTPPLSFTRLRILHFAVGLL
jgi:hypothetical protein